MYIFDREPIRTPIRGGAEFQPMREPVSARMADWLQAYHAGELTLP
jgi:hypothetical protein